MIDVESLIIEVENMSVSIYLTLLGPIRQKLQQNGNYFKNV